MITRCNVGLDVMMNTFFYWKDAWFLDTSASCHMSFLWEFFEELSKEIDGEVYFVYRSMIKPSGIGTIQLKLLGFVDFIIWDILYLPKLKRHLLSLVLVCQPSHSIHIFYGKVEIHRLVDNQIVMIGVEDKKLLKLKWNYTRSNNFIFLTH